MTQSYKSKLGGEKIDKTIEEIEDWNVNEEWMDAPNLLGEEFQKGLDIAAQILKKHIGE